MQNNPQISIVIRTYNSEKFIKKAINSVLNQTINQELLDILVVDDGSTDNTKNILDSFKKKIRIFKRQHNGAMKSLNFGIANAKGKYVIILDADDIFEQTILEKMFDAIQNNKNISFVYCDYYQRNKNREIKKVSLKNIFNSLAGGIMFEKEIIVKMGGYQEDMVFPEYDLLIKIIKKYKGKHIQEPLFTYVRHKGSITDNKEIVQKGMAQLFKKYGNIKNIKKY